MDLLDRLLDHDRWATTQLLERSRGLNDVQLDQEFDIDRTTGGKWNWVLGNTRVNELRVGYTHEKNGFTAPEIQDGIPGINLAPTLQMLGSWFDGPNNGAQFRIDNAYELSEAYSWFLPKFAGGNNDLKFGGQFIYSTIELPDQTDMNGRFAFSTDKSFNNADASTYPERLFIRVPDASDILMPTDVVVLFVQDKWRRNNLTLNFGVRYDLELTPITNAFNPAFTNGDHAVDGNNFAPRLGVTWTPGGSSKTVLRGELLPEPVHVAGHGPLGLELVSEDVVEGA